MIRRHHWMPVVLLAALCGFLFFYGLSAGDLWRTEGLRAAVASSCLRGESWVVPTLFGEPLFTKPPGIYVAIALCSWPFGVITEATARLPSALAATATVFLFYWYFARQLGRLGGFVAAVILPLSIVWLDKAPSAEIDMLQLFWVSAAVLFFLRALGAEEEASVLSTQYSVLSTPRRVLMPWWLLSLLCVAGGVLTKWTAPVFFYATVIPLLWWRGRLRLLLQRRHLLSAAVAATVCVGWAAWAVAETGWSVFWDTVSREAVQRLSPAHALEARQVMPHHADRLPIWAEGLLHPLVVLAANLPWSAFALVALWPGFAKLWDERGRRLLQALHCWAWPSLLFWSVLPEHAVRHSMPLFPALAGLAAMVWLAWLDGRLKWPALRSVKPAGVLLGLVLVWVVAKVVFVEAVVPRRNPNRAPRAKGELLDSLVPAGKPLYVARLKDEGILFYFGRSRPLGLAGPPVQKVADLEVLLSQPEPVYCILDAAEWQRWQQERKADLVHGLVDEQGAPIVLVRTRPARLARAEGRQP
jgi:4-amino-4-deoxy-L-arabinose transferase-like glycosyltransferase